MNCVSFRRAVVSAPTEATPEMLSHRRECSGCEIFARSQEAFERTLAQALRIDVPVELESQVLLAHGLGLKSERRLRRRRLVALVPAGLVLGSLVSWLALGPGPLDGEVLSHIEKEASHLEERRQLSPAQVNEVLAPLEIALVGDLGAVRYAGTCWVRTGLGAHLVLSGERGPITVLILPGEPVASRIPIRAPRFQGVIAPMGRGSIAIVAEPGEPLDVVERRLRRSLRGSAQKGPSPADGSGQSERKERHA